MRQQSRHGRPDSPTRRPSGKQIPPAACLLTLKTPGHVVTAALEAHIGPALKAARKKIEYVIKQRAQPKRLRKCSRRTA